MALDLHLEAERIAQGHIQRIQSIPYDGVTGGATSHAHSYLIHIYLLAEGYEKAYHNMVMQVENYFEMLVYRTDLPEDTILSAYSQLAFLVRRLGN